MKVTPWTNVLVGFQIFLPDDLFALIALRPKAFRSYGFVSNLDDRSLALLKPRHKKNLLHFLNSGCSATSSIQLLAKEIPTLLDLTPFYMLALKGK